MNTKDVANNYLLFRARGATPVGIVVLLYDTAIESLRLAKQAAENGRIEDRVASSNHVLLVINELSRTLDHERGGQVAGNLDRFYSVARARLMEANVRSDPAIFEHLLAMFCSLREAWQRVEIETAGAAAASAAGPSLPPSETSLAGWSA